MVIGKTRAQTPKPPALPTAAQKENRALLREITRLIWLATATYLLLALVSYSASDPSWSTWTSKTEFRNWMGRVGSVTSDLLLQTLGLGAFALVALFTTFGLAPRREGENGSVFAPIALLVTGTALLQCTIPTHWMPWNLQNPGGLWGSLAQTGLAYASGTWGARLLAAIATLACAMLTFRLYAVSWTVKTVPAAARSMAAAPQSMFARWKEARAKAREARAQRKNAAKGLTVAAAPLAPQAAKAAISENLLPAAIVPPAPSAATHAASAVTAFLGGTVPPIQKDESRDEELFRLTAAKTGAVPKARETSTKPKGPAKDFQLPTLDALSGKADSKMKTVDRSWYLEKANILVQKLKDFGVDGEVVHISPGPVITVYEFKPASGVKIKEIANLSDDLTLALSVLSVRIVAPIPGKPVVGIEIPSPHREMVFFKDMVQETPFYSDEVKIPIVLGRLASGEPVVAGLASMPHLLVAGSTGTGKSVFINNMICSLLCRYTPQQLKLILVDPKMVELACYEGVPHLMLPVVIDSKKAALALRWAVEEMERRYSLLHKMGVRHIEAYNQKIEGMDPKELEREGQDPLIHMPYIVVVVDEYADLMAVVPKDVELSIARLAQKARASGIHLVLATQRPSTDVVTGTIKANFPSRISFRVASSIDSKTILDRTGADRLLGQGDMLFHSAGFTSLKRIQGAFISDADLERIVEGLKAQGEPEYDERLLQAQESGDPEMASFDDEGDGDAGARLYDNAVRLVSEKGEASISLIQRHLKIGYNRAASLMEEMEKQGVVAPASSGVKRRQVLVGSL